MYEYIKKILKLFLYKTKRVLTILRDSALPENRFLEKDYRSPYKLYEKEELEKCYNHFKKYFKTAIFLDSNSIRKYSIKRASENDKKQEYYYLEFGVFRGTTINRFSEHVHKIYGFDSFEGLKEDWVGMDSKPKGTFNLNKILPKLNQNVVPIVGWIQETLKPFLEKEKPKVNFIHVDVDTYETTKFILENIKPHLTKKSIILFDELYNLTGWDVGEYKALTEVFKENEYKFIAFSKFGHQVAIEII
tara:strand:- start:1050 stop:1790 length:741 start_codon:yes stop_codon:yes gene_type:complete